MASNNPRPAYSQSANSSRKKFTLVCTICSNASLENNVENSPVWTMPTDKQDAHLEKDIEGWSRKKGKECWTDSRHQMSLAQAL